MENIFFSLSVVLPLFLTMFLGYFLRRVNVFSDDFIANCNKACFQIFLPSLIFYSIYSNEGGFRSEIKTVTFTIVASSILILLLVIVVPLIVKDKIKIGAVIQGLFRSNAVIFGIPLVMNLYGEGGIGPISIIVAVIVPYFNFLTVIILSVFDVTKKVDTLLITKVLVDLIKNPLIIASLIALFFDLTGIILPQFIVSTIKSISNVATPLSLMALGAAFRFHRLSHNIKYLLYICTFKMILMPAAMVIIAISLGFRNTQLAGLMVLYATPIAVSSYVMTREASGDYELAGQLVVMSTFYSIFTIFLFIYVLRSLGYI
ncbi:MAG: AEC family transporter [Clostridiales bacterium]|nr:AEC family transporter [Clostridiales bacterium]